MFQSRTTGCVSDFVTPLKKRRLARESVESPFPFASAAAAVPTAAVGDSQGDGSSNTSEAHMGSCEAAPVPTEHRSGDATSSPFRDSCQPSRMSPEVSSGDNLFEVCSCVACYDDYWTVASV